MALNYDPEVSRLVAAGGVHTPTNVQQLRTFIDQGCRDLLSRLPAAPGVSADDFQISKPGGAHVQARWFRVAGHAPGSAVVYAHGGGMIAGSVNVYEPLIRHYVSLTGVPFLAVGYGLAPEHASDGLSADVYRAVCWLKAHASALEVDGDRIAVMGDSGGGGVAAAAAIRARDGGVVLARQILIYPMLDDRTTRPDPALDGLALWTAAYNVISWGAIPAQLCDQCGHVAPARLRDFRNLAPAFIEVGELDIFRNEAVAYAQNLWAAGVSCDLQVQAGLPHGAEWLDPDAAFSRRIFGERARILTAL